MRETDMATNCWYDELFKPGYDYKKRIINKGNGHFTQVVWKDCDYVGHGVSGGYICGRYWPPGNYDTV